MDIVSENVAPKVNMSVDDSIVDISKPLKTPTSKRDKLKLTTPRDQSRPTTASSASKKPTTPHVASNTPLKEAARLAKLQSTAERRKKVSDLKEKWAKEKEEKAQINKDKRVTELKKLQEATNHAAEERRKAIEKQRQLDQEQKNREREILSHSLVTRSLQAEKLAQEAKAKRRISIFLNNKMRKQAKTVAAEMAQATKQRQQDELYHRRIETLNGREAKKLEEIRRRESIIGRGHVAQSHREVASAQAAEQQAYEKGLLESRYQNWKDEQKLKKELDQYHRDSVANRLDDWRHQKQQEACEKAEASKQERRGYAVRHEDNKCIQEYKRELVNRDRKSLAGRLQKWRAEKKEEKLRAEQDELERIYNQELAQQDRDNAKAYELEQKLNRRDSLAHRLEKARLDKTFDQAKKEEQRLIEEEDYRLRKEDHQDVQEYKQQIIEARRLSMDYRNNIEYKNERLRQEAERQAQKAEEAADRLLQYDCWRDVKEHQARQREEARKSLSFRLAQAHREKEMDLANHRLSLDAMHQAFQDRRMDGMALKEEQAKQAERSRKSIQLRLDSWRSQRMLEEKVRAKIDFMAEQTAMQLVQDNDELIAAKLTQEMMLRHSIADADSSN